MNPIRKIQREYAIGAQKNHARAPERANKDDYGGITYIWMALADGALERAFS
jgi:hypothetical protein